MLLYVIVLDFGYGVDSAWRTSIDDLADCTEKFCAKCDPERTVVLAQSATYACLRQRSKMKPGQVQEIKVGQSTTNGTAGGGSYHVLKEARRMIIDDMLKKTGMTPSFPYTVLVVAHKAHLPRVKKQGMLRNIRLNLVPIENLPSAFYDTAAQWWCRNQLLWCLREAIGYVPLKIMGQL